MALVENLFPTLNRAIHFSILNKGCDVGEMINPLLLCRSFSSECFLEAKGNRPDLGLWQIGFVRVMTLCRPAMKNALGETIVGELEANVKLLEAE